MNWKSSAGVSDEGAHAAGVFSTPSSTWDVAIAQQATRVIDEARAKAGYSPPTPGFTPTSFQGSGGTGHTAASSAGPVSVSASESGALGRLWDAIRKLVLALCLLPVGLVTAALLVLLATGFLTTPSTSGVDVESLRNEPIDPAFYVASSSLVMELAETPASVLFATQLKGAPDSWSQLNGRQRAAVEAAWFRYLQNPEAFGRLEQRQFFFSVFEGYLGDLGYRTSDPIPLLDRGRLVYDASPRSAYKLWADGSLSLPGDPSLAALALEDPHSGKLSYWMALGLIWWAEFFVNSDLRREIVS